MRSLDVRAQLSRLFLERGTPAFLRSDIGPELTAQLLRDWLQALGVTTLFIEPGSPWEKGNVESFHGKLRDELLDREIFYTLKEARVLLIESWRRHYNERRPHSALGYRAPAPAARLLPDPVSATSDGIGKHYSPELQHDLWYKAWGQVTSSCGLATYDDATRERGPFRQLPQNIA